MNNLKIREILLILGAILIIVLVLVINLVWPHQGNKGDNTNATANVSTNTKDNINTNIATQTDKGITASVSSTGEWVAILNNNKLEVVNIETAESYWIEGRDELNIHSLLWSSDGKRIYFAETIFDPIINTEFVFMDVMGKDKFVSTGLTPAVTPKNANIFMAELYLVGAKGDTLYFQSGNKLYELPIYGIGDVGGTPRLIKDFSSIENIDENVNNNITTSSKREFIMSVSPVGDYIALLLNEKFMIVNLTTNEKNILMEYTTSEKIHSLLWNNDGGRLYYAHTRRDPFLITEFGYVDVAGANKFITSGLVPNVAKEKEEIFKTELKLVGAKDSILFFQLGDKLYEMPIIKDGSNDGGPKLIKNLNLTSTNTND